MKTDKKSAKAQIVELKDDNELEEFLVSEGPRVLQMHATWCAPCQKVAPILEKLARKYKGRVSFGKVDIDQVDLVREMMTEFSILGVPAVMVLGNGKGGTLIGAKDAKEYQKAIEQILEAKKTELQAREGVGCPMHF